MDIKILDKLTAEKIAAGEVIENPASVVKELVENSIDAGATIISVEIEGGGKNFIAVTDNGNGIKPADLSLAFKRFATSKLNAIKDLDSLASLGFRGEALPSIAAVSKVELTSRNEESLAASKIVFEGGELVEQTEAGAPKGTRVVVRDLFFNTPGRLKFLRADSIESAKISSLLSEISLAYPGIAFKLNSGKRDVIKTTGDGNLLHVIGALYGNDSAKAMIEISRKKSDLDIRLDGYISAPHLTRSSRRWITLIVNGRLVKNAMLTNAIERAYSDLIPRQRHPIAVLWLSIPPAKLDVNVHPAKTEIRFLEPETVKNIVYRAVKQSVQDSPGSPKRLTDINYDLEPPLNSLQATFLWEKTLPEATYKTDHTSDTDHDLLSVKPGYLMGESYTESYRLIGQFLQSYLLVQKGDELLLIDQHAAHERINYDVLERNSGADSNKNSIQLIMPFKIEFPPSWSDRLQDLIPVLNDHGFHLEWIGEDSYVIRSVPFNFSTDTSSEQIYDLIENILASDCDNNDEYEKLIRKNIACHRSVKAKQPLSREEMEKLIKELIQTPNSDYCPHGRPTTIRFNRSQIEKWFQRKGR